MTTLETILISAVAIMIGLGMIITLVKDIMSYNAPYKQKLGLMAAGVALGILATILVLMGYWAAMSL